MNSITTYPQAGSRRRLARHARNGFDRRLFCGTNGCATRLELDERSGKATCPICGFHRTVASPHN